MREWKHPVFSDDESYGIVEIAEGFGERSALGIRSRQSLHVGDVPAAAFLNDTCEFSFHSGMLPCFFLGLVSRLFSRARRAVMMRARVSAGSISVCMYPRSAATKRDAQH